VRVHKLGGQAEAVVAPVQDPRLRGARPPVDGLEHAIALGSLDAEAPEQAALGAPQQVAQLEAAVQALGRRHEHAATVLDAQPELGGPRGPLGRDLTLPWDGDR
jgi:hypothetical protein